MPLPAGFERPRLVARLGEPLGEGGKRRSRPARRRRQTGDAVVRRAPKRWQVSAGYDAARHGLLTNVGLGALPGWADGELDGQPDG